MFKIVMDLTFILLLVVGTITHIFRLIYLLFKPRVLEKFNFLHLPSKFQLSLYYILVIVICVYVIFLKLNHF
jgi:hypothetical protein